MPKPPAAFSALTTTKSSLQALRRVGKREITASRPLRPTTSPRNSRRKAPSEELLMRQPHRIVWRRWKAEVGEPKERPPEGPPTARGRHGGRGSRFGKNAAEHLGRDKPVRSRRIMRIIYIGDPVIGLQERRNVRVVEIFPPRAAWPVT